MSGQISGLKSQSNMASGRLYGENGENVIYWGNRGCEGSFSEEIISKSIFF